MKDAIRRGLSIAALLSGTALSGCVVWQSDYDALNAKYQQSQQQVAAQQAQLTAAQAQITRLQGAIKYTVNSDLLFPSGGYQMSPSGQQVIARLASQLAPSQQNHIVVNGYTDNAPVGAALKAQGITDNQILSEKRADNVMQYLISQGVNPSYISAKGWGEANPVGSNNTAQGRAQNRRVELTLGGPVS